MQDKHKSRGWHDNYNSKVAKEMRRRKKFPLLIKGLELIKGTDQDLMNEKGDNNNLT